MLNNFIINNRTFCKIGILTYENYEVLKNKFPKWKTKLYNQYETNKKILINDLSFWGKPRIEREINLFNTNNDFKIVDEKLIEHYSSYIHELENNEKEKELKKDGYLTKNDEQENLVALTKSQSMGNIITKSN